MEPYFWGFEQVLATTKMENLGLIDKFRERERERPFWRIMASEVIGALEYRFSPLWWLGGGGPRRWSVVVVVGSGDETRLRLHRLGPSVPPPLSLNQTIVISIYIFATFFSFKRGGAHHHISSSG